MPKIARKTTKAKTTRRANGRRPSAPAVIFKPTRLKLLQPVPSDIEIAQAGKLKPILQIAPDLRAFPGARGAPGPARLYLHPPALAGADLWHQGRRGRRRVLADYPHGGLQPPPDGRHPRRERGEQPARRRD